MLLAFFALSNVDIVIARNVLTEHDAGLYAGGLILTKAVLFLPQFVVVIAFPSMSTIAERRRALTGSLGLIAAVGAVATAGAVVLPDLALIFVGGDELRRDRGPPLDLRDPRHRAVDAAAAGLLGARPAGASDRCSWSGRRSSRSSRSA